jgi:hypothetical protein
MQQQYWKYYCPTKKLAKCSNNTESVTAPNSLESIAWAWASWGRSDNNDTPTREDFIWMTFSENTLRKERKTWIHKYAWKEHNSNLQEMFQKKKIEERDQKHKSHKKFNLQACSDEAKTASSGAKGVIDLTAWGKVLCIEEPSRIGVTTT